MNMQKACASQIAIIAGLLSTLIIGPVYADETCKTSCADELKACRQQADQTADYEVHPVISGSSKSTVYGNGQLTPLVRTNERANSQDAEIQQRKMDRYQACAAENNHCQTLCSPKPAPSKNSVIFK